MVGVDDYNDLENLDYAVSDASTLFRLLTDKTCGTAGIEESRLLTGSSASSKDVTRAAIRLAAMASPGDLFLYYFAGHAKRIDQKTYLLYHGMSQRELLESPPAFPDLGDLVEYLTEHCRGVVLMIIDACEVDGADGLVNDGLGLLRQRAEKKDVILLYSSDLDGGSQESATLGHGVFTDRILNCLRDGKGRLTDRVTLRDLVNIARVGVTTFRLEADPTITYPHRSGETTVLIDVASTSGLEPLLDLRHPLDNSLPWLNALADITERAARGNAAVSEAERVRLVLEGFVERFDLVAAHVVQTFQTRAGLAKAQLVSSAKELSLERDLMHAAVLGFGEVLFDDRLWSRTRAGVQCRITPSPSGELTVVAIPIDPRPHANYLLLYGSTSQELLNYEYFARAAGSALHRAALGGTKDEVLGAALDSLRDVAGFVPADLYRRRFELFLAECATVVPFFQPIVSSGDHLHVEGFEALARVRRLPLDVLDVSDDSQSRFRTPEDLFLVANKWGRRFMAAFDGHMAAQSLREFSRQTFSAETSNFPFKLSLNCFVESLLGDRFPSDLERLLIECRFPGKQLVLEISERPKLSVGAAHDAEPESRSGLAPFRDLLRGIGKRLDVQFAIDDFGVERANVSRVRGLNLAYVKIDRSILEFEKDLALRTFSYVYELVFEFGSHPYVVAEGWDPSCGITMQDLMRVGCSAVQGYGTGRPMRTVEEAINDAKGKPTWRQVDPGLGLPGPNSSSSSQSR